MKRSPLRRKTRLKSGTITLKRSALKKGGRIKTKGKRRFPNKAAPAYLAWIRLQPCAMVGREVVSVRGYRVGPHLCSGKVQAAHVQSKGAGGEDRGNTIPLCAMSHAYQHTTGITSWAAMYGLSVDDLKLEAARYLIAYEREAGSVTQGSRGLSPHTIPNEKGE